MIELYGMGSPNVRKVGLMLEELGLPYALHHVRVFKGEQFTPAFLAMNPMAKVPVLVDGDRGQTIFESGAILFYLAETYKRFLPTGPARYEVMQWLMVQMASIGPMFGQHNHFSMLPEDEHPYAAARYRAQAERLYRVLDDRLAAHEWLAGGEYSIADIATWPWATYLEQHGFDPAAHPALVRWRDAIGARPAAVRCLERFDETFSKPTTEELTSATPADLDRFFNRKDDVPAVTFDMMRAARAKAAS